MDFRPKCPPVYDHGQLGGCTANAIGAAHQFERMKQKAKSAFVPSRLFIYFNERLIEHTENQGSGAMIHDGMKTIVHQGSDWPYVTARFTNKPPAPCNKKALDHQVVSYQRLVQTERQMKA